MAPVTLLPVTPENFPTFLAEAAATYAAGASASGEMTYAAALVRAGEDLEALLPHGLGTPDMLVRRISVSGRTVGHIWVGLRGAPPAAHGWVWSVFVRPAHRGHGYAAEAMQLAEIEARSVFGIDEVRLSVFAANRSAVDLYERLGYSVTPQVMSRKLS